ncbi:MAG: AAA family ATPase [Desulfovibrio sp.]|nr:AAA family ATPase [Desulfovibrio sp.]
MQELPTGLQEFAMLRQHELLYVDKTARLLEMISIGRRLFLSRPRRFGKSLTVSTLDAMFSGRQELFAGLAAEEWVGRQAGHPCPVLRLDMSGLAPYASAKGLQASLTRYLEISAEEYGLTLSAEQDSSVMLSRLLKALYEQRGEIVLLIDEYDKPILDNILNVKKANRMRFVLRQFFTTLKSCDRYLRFVFITGISTFTKAGIFSAMNNLNDISFSENFGDLTGYTQQEIELYFKDWIEATLAQKNIKTDDLLKTLKEYYDGFSFDGVTRVYNPFSILVYFSRMEIGNYWYESGSPSFIVNWMKEHQIYAPENYRHIDVDSNFTNYQEVEEAAPESFLFQSGYLTIEKKSGMKLTLDYPNAEVLNSITAMYLNTIYKIRAFRTLGAEIWKALEACDLARLVQLLNRGLADVAYEDFPGRDEFWYRSLFRMLLRGADVVTHAEVHTSKGRSDVVVQWKNTVIVLEFKFAAHSADVERVKTQGLQQMREKRYAEGYVGNHRKVLACVIVADDEKRQADFCLA